MRGQELPQDSTEDLRYRQVLAPMNLRGKPPVFWLSTYWLSIRVRLATLE